MHVKIFKGQTFQKALDCVRQDFGPDAFILDTKDHQGWVEIKAGIESQNHASLYHDGFPGSQENFPHHASQKKKENYFDTLSQGAILKSDNSQIFQQQSPSFSSSAHYLQSIFCEHDIDQECINQMINHISKNKIFGDNTTQRNIFNTLFNFQHDFFSTSRRVQKPLVIAGPYGSGKTTAIAKIAHTLSKTHHDISVMTCDGVKSSSFSELKEFLKDTQIYPLFCQQFSVLQREIGLHKNSIVLIDTPGINIYNSDDVAFLKHFASLSTLDLCLLIPSDLCYRDAQAFLNVVQYSPSLILSLSKTDMTIHHKNLCQLPWETKNTLGFVTSSPLLNDDIDVINSKILERILKKSLTIQQKVA